MYTISIHDGVSPAIQRWVADMSPAVLRSFRRGGVKSKRILKAEIGAMLHSRTGQGVRGVKYSAERTPTGAVIAFWNTRGYMSAHERGSAIPERVVRPGKRGAGRHLAAFTLPRRPWLTTPSNQIAQLIQSILDEDMTRLAANVG